VPDRCPEDCHKLPPWTHSTGAACGFDASIPRGHDAEVLGDEPCVTIDVGEEDAAYEARVSTGTRRRSGLGSRRAAS